LRQFLENGEPPIIFTLGTTAVNDPGTFFEESAVAARRLGRRAVLVVGRSNEVQFENMSDDAIVVPYAPHELLFPHGLAIVHQGGIGTLSEALLAGKPMLIMPYGHDQADNAWRATRLGVARIIPRGRYRAGAVSRGLAQLIDDPIRPAAAANVSRFVAHERGAESAAKLIDEALR
jgi:UDP:flavonoid glycosyltransferase YjiC (YdhE family)